MVHEGDPIVLNNNNALLQSIKQLLVAIALRIVQSCLIHDLLDDRLAEVAKRGSYEACEYQREDQRLNCVVVHVFLELEIPKGDYRDL